MNDAVHCEEEPRGTRRAESPAGPGACSLPLCVDQIEKTGNEHSPLSSFPVGKNRIANYHYERLSTKP